ncbi:Alpha/Beta hydrolase protein [Baffinella frigidus]|nr:Alpha/Beta hydrolase protein [Cryptophyta sp. CCMP2293]
MTAVLVHGAGGGGWEYDLWRGPLAAAGWSVVALDLQPCAAGLAATTLDDYVQQVLGWVAAAAPAAPHRPLRLVLVGASMGGAIVLKAAEALGLDSYDAVVLVNAVVPEPYGMPADDPSAPAIEKVKRWAGGAKESTMAAMPDSTPAMQELAHRSWRDESGQALHSSQYGLRCARPPRARLLFVIGEDDTDVPAARQAAWAAGWGGEQLCIAGMGHVSPLLAASAADVAYQEQAGARRVLSSSDFSENYRPHESE